MNDPSKPAEPSIPPKKLQPSPDSAATNEELSAAAPLEVVPASECNEPPSAPWWKLFRKVLLDAIVFAGLSTVIVLTVGMFKMMSIDHDMGRWSMAS